MALDLDRLRSSPHLIPVFKPTLAGVDYLNLRQVNLDFMGECIPGTNNTTRRVRGYSLITWIYWVYPRILETLGRSEASSEELILFREKVESLFVWGHQLDGFIGMPGISSKVPASKDGKVDLRFSAWKRSRANTSLEAAVQYGPSLLDLGGLGLIHKVCDGIYACTKAGQSLGRALDEQLRKCSEYGYLTDLSRLDGTEEQAMALLPYWRFDETSPSEAAVFRKILWDSKFVGEKSRRGRRASMVELILTMLGHAKAPLDIDEIRKRLALPGIWCEGPLPEGLLRQSRSWLILQLRQLQRFALECLMSWLENQLIHRGHQLPDALVGVATQFIAEELQIDPEAPTADALLMVRKPFSSLEEFQGRVAKDPDWFSPWVLADELAEAVAEGDNRVLTSAFYCLLMLNQCRPFMEADDLLSRHLERGDAARQSLAHWFRTVERFQSRPARELIDWTIKNLVVSQHFAVGTQRFDGEKIRLRMVLEQDGLESLVLKKPWQPAPTPDRLAALLSLLESCGVVTLDGDECYALI